MKKEVDISDKIMRLDPNENRVLRYLLGPPQLTGWKKLIHRLLTSRKQLRVEKSELDAFLERRRTSEAIHRVARRNWGDYA